MICYIDGIQLRIRPSDARAMFHPGDCTEDVRACAAMPRYARQLDAISPDVIRACLSEYGAWDAVDLADDEANRERLLWIAAGEAVEARR